MDNIILLNRTAELEKKCKELGFSSTLFLEDVQLITSKKELMKAKKFSIFRPPSEEELRFALERSPVDMVIGMEQINPKDSVHFVRGGLDQVTCKIAAAKGKMIGFSFSDILHSSDRGGLLSRMMFNIKLCKKYKVKMFFGNFSASVLDIRSKKDLSAFGRVLGL